MKLKWKYILLLVSALLFTGCASVTTHEEAEETPPTSIAPPIEERPSQPVIPAPPPAPVVQPEPPRPQPAPPPLSVVEPELPSQPQPVPEPVPVNGHAEQYSAALNFSDVPWYLPVIGTILILLAVVFSMYFNPMSQEQRLSFRTMLALGASSYASMIPGFIQLDTKDSNVYPAGIQAGGAIVIFLLVFFGLRKENKE